MNTNVRNCCGVFVLLLAVNLTGCKVAPKEPIKTIVPPRIELTQPSFDGNEQDSGIKDYINGKGFLITKGALSRYQGLVSIYGSKEIPVINPQDGVISNEDGTFFLSDESMIRFIEYNQKRVNGR